MSSLPFTSLMLAALAFAAAPIYSADSGEITVDGSVITWFPTNGGTNGVANLSLAFTRSDGQADFNPGRVTLSDQDGKIFELNDLGNAKVTHFLFDMPGLHWDYNIATVSTHLTVDRQGYQFGAWAVKVFVNGQSFLSSASAFLNTEPTYENPYGSQVWFASGNPVENVVVVP